MVKIGKPRLWMKERDLVQLRDQWLITHKNINELKYNNKDLKRKLTGLKSKITKNAWEIKKLQDGQDVLTNKIFGVNGD